MHVFMYSFLGNYLIYHIYLIRYLGSCGRVAVAEGELTPLAHQLAKDWDTRSELALQVHCPSPVSFGQLTLKRPNVCFDR
jgi:hypothetical protein